MALEVVGLPDVVLGLEALPKTQPRDVLLRWGSFATPLRENGSFPSDDPLHHTQQALRKHIRVYVHGRAGNDVPRVCPMILSTAVVLVQSMTR